MLYIQAQVAKGEALYHLVTGKLAEFNHHFEEVFANLPSLAATAIELSGCNTLPQGEIHKLQLLTRKLLLQHWSAFRRRVVKPLSQTLDFVMPILPICHMSYFCENRRTGREWSQNWSLIVFEPLTFDCRADHSLAD